MLDTSERNCNGIIISLVRMGQKPNGAEFKIKTPITVEDQIQIPNHDGSIQQFELVCSIEHIGSNSHSGHYITHYK